MATQSTAEGTAKPARAAKEKTGKPAAVKAAAPAEGGAPAKAKPVRAGKAAAPATPAVETKAPRAVKDDNRKFVVAEPARERRGKTGEHVALALSKFNKKPFTRTAYVEACTEFENGDAVEAKSVWTDAVRRGIFTPA